MPGRMVSNNKLLLLFYYFILFIFSSTSECFLLSTTSNTCTNTSQSHKGTARSSDITTTPTSSSSGAKLEKSQETVGWCNALGGEIKRIKLENENDGFLTKLSVPTFATFQSSCSKESFAEDHPDPLSRRSVDIDTIRKGLEDVVPGAFLVENAMDASDCESIIEACEKIGFGKFKAGKNHHGALQILVTDEVAQSVGSRIFQHLDVSSINAISASLPGSLKMNVKYKVVGLNRRWRVYRYDAGGEEKFAPHIDAGFPPSTLSKDGTTLIWDAIHNEYDEQDYPSQQVYPYPPDTVSRLTVLMYLNDDFEGGHTKFYAAIKSSLPPENEVIAAVKPKTGSILLFPQAVGDEAVEYARRHWPLHEGSPVFSGRPKYVIRSDVLFTVAS